ncbi:MAG: TonB-dependent receptor, partial [Hyphomicrobium sp.]|nr:TonB-dependent receptor [Hyphomicrobium sp.]
VQKDNNFALFTHNIFSITDRLKLTLGARYTWDKKKLDVDLRDNNAMCAFFAAAVSALQQIPCVIPSVPGGIYSDSDTKREGKLSGTVVLSWKPIDQILLYASASRGYKAGGFNLDRASLPRSGATFNGAVLPSARVSSLRFDPEINTAFELGLKYDGSRIDANLAVFRQDFEDFQLNTFNGINFEVANVNSCDDIVGSDTDNSSATGFCDGKVRSGVRSQGAELEIYTRPFRDARLNFGLTYVQTKYRNDLVGSSGQPLSNQLFQLPGRNISNAPEVVATSSFSYTPPIGSSGLRALFYIDARHSSSYNTGSDLDLEKVQKSFTLVNARIGLRGPDNIWAVELWSQNLFNKNYKQVAFDVPLQGSCTERGALNNFCSPNPGRSTQLFGAFLGEPRTYGLTLRGRLGQPRPVPVAEPLPPPPPPPPAATQTCPDGSVILATDMCPPPPPPPPPPPEPERG